MDNRLKVNTPVQYPIYPVDVLNFDGSVLVLSNYGIAEPNGVIDMSFKLWLDKSSGYDNGLFQYCSSINTGTQAFNAFLKDSSIYIGQRMNSPYKGFSIAGLSNKILECTIRKNENGTDNFDFFKINGVTQVSSGTYPANALQSGSTILSIIGGGPYAGGNESYLWDAAMWDFRFTEVSTGIRKHWYDGWHDASLMAGWIDRIPDSQFFIPINNAGHQDRITTRTIGGRQLPSNKLKLDANVSGSSPLLVFDPSVTVGKQENDPSINGILDLSFKMYLDTDSNYFNGLFAFSNSPTGQSFYGTLIDSSLYLSQQILGPNTSYSIKTLQNQVLDCVVRKGETGAPVTFFKINGVTQTAGSTLNPTGSTLGTWIGTPGMANVLGNIPKKFMGSIWDVKITEVSTGKLNHYWKGYPDPTTDAAWIDHGIYPMDLSIFDLQPGSPLQTRIIAGEGGTGETASSNKLLLGLPVLGDYMSVFPASNDIFVGTRQGKLLKYADNDYTYLHPVHIQSSFQNYPITDIFMQQPEIEQPVFYINSGPQGIMVSTDGAVTFTPVSGIESNRTYRRYARTGALSIVYTTDGSLFRSVDQGATMYPINSANATNATGVRFSPYNASIGWLCRAGGSVAKTTDGGVTWTSQSISTVTLNGMAAIDNSTFIACGSSGKIYRTTNNSTWAEVSSGTTLPFLDADTVNNSVWVVGGTDSSGGVVYETPNAGLTWNVPTNYYWALELDLTVQYNQVMMPNSWNPHLVGNKARINEYSFP